MSQHDDIATAFDAAWNAIRERAPQVWGKNAAREMFDAGRAFEAVRLERRYAVIPVVVSYTTATGDGEQEHRIEAWRLAGPYTTTDMIAFGTYGLRRLQKRAQAMNASLDDGREVKPTEDGWQHATPPTLPVANVSRCVDGKFIPATGEDRGKVQTEHPASYPGMLVTLPGSPSEASAAPDPPKSPSDPAERT